MLGAMGGGGGAMGWLSTALTVKRKAEAVWAVLKRCMPLLFVVALLLMNKASPDPNSQP